MNSEAHTQTQQQTQTQSEGQIENDSQSQAKSIATMHMAKFKKPPPVRRCFGDPIEQSTETIECTCEEEEEESTLEMENVTVKLQISESEVVAQSYPNFLTIAEIKEDIAEKFEVSADFLIFTQCNMVVCDNCVLHDTCTNDFGIYEFNIEVAKDKDGKPKALLCMDIYNSKHRLPDFITVHIAGEDTENGEPKDVIVEIQNRAILKPFLCGYRNKATGIEYLDAFTQTGPQFDKWVKRRYISRDTQTYETTDHQINTAHDQMSQCFIDGNNVQFISEPHDYIITPGKYETYAQKVRRENKLGKVTLIQRNWRRYLMEQLIKRAAAENRRLVANRNAEDERFNNEIARRISREERAKQFPYTKADFELLFGEVQKWKIAELKRIAGLYDGPARIAEVNILLDKEVQMLNNIERQRTIVQKAMQDFREEQLLTKLGTPIQWVGYRDKRIHLDLIRTQRVRFLHEVYKDMKKITEKEPRLELLQKVKDIVLRESCFPDFPELFDLLDREYNLLIYTQYCDVEILRKRQNLLFFEFIKWSEDHEEEKKPKRMCEVCKKVKTYSEFAVIKGQRVINTCKTCYYLKIGSSDNSIYTAILHSIQRDERKRRCNRSIAFVLQIDDIRVLLDQIWHRHSILSKNPDITKLRFPRWIVGDDWAPWNCVCLTETEARNHYRLTDLEKVYDKKLIEEVGNRHKLARQHFRPLAAVDCEFVETGQWWKVGLNQQRKIDMSKVFREISSKRDVKKY